MEQGQQTREPTNSLDTDEDKISIIDHYKNRQAVEIATGISTYDYLDHRVYTSLLKPGDKSNTGGPSLSGETPPMDTIDYLQPVKPL